MATKKSTPKTAEVATPANTFEGELDLILNDVFKEAPEFKSALADELTVLKEKLISAYKEYSKQESTKKDEQLREAITTISLMESDMNSLKTTILRMAITQYGA